MPSCLFASLVAERLPVWYQGRLSIPPRLNPRSQLEEDGVVRHPGKEVNDQPDPSGSVLP